MEVNDVLMERMIKKMCIKKDLDIKDLKLGRWMVQLIFN